MFVSRDYLEMKSKPEWGLSLTKARLASLAEFTFDQVAPTL